MSYANGSQLRLIGGRLALDFVNTADWAANGAVVDEKLEARADMAVWLRAVGLPDAQVSCPIEDVKAFRQRLRDLLLDGAEAAQALEDLDRYIREFALRDAGVQAQPAMALIAASALALLGDPRDAARLKMCPGDNCGWLFRDETKNGRRKWCTMETCGNRAKAARHYRRRTAD